MLVMDMHCDTLSLLSETRGLVSDYNISSRHNHIQFFAEFVPASGRAPSVRRRELIRLLNGYLYETDRLDIKRIHDAKDLIGACDNMRLSSVLTVEGGGGLFADSEELFTLHRAGLRVLGLAWDTNELAASALDPNDTGLTDDGRALVRTLGELGVTVDVSHLSDRGFAELMDISPYPVVATHSNFREVCPSQRNLTRDMAKQIVARGGVIGLNLYPPFLSSEAIATEADILRQVDYALEHLGEGSLGFGFDIDGTDGIYPEGFSEAGSIHDKVVDLLLSHYSDSVVRRIAGENVRDFLLGVL